MSKQDMRLPTSVRRYYEGPLWDTLHFPAGCPCGVTGGVRRSAFFTTPVGQAKRPWGGAHHLQSPIDTNMEEGSRISSGLAMTVCEVQWDVWGNHMEDVTALVTQSALSWGFLNTEVDIAPLTTLRVLQGFDPRDLPTRDSHDVVELDVDVTKLDEARQFFLDTAMLPNMYRSRSIYAHLPVLLPANTSFWVYLDTAGKFTPKGAVHLRVSLDGVITSAIPVRS